jgi:DNA-binding MarR family transcriptional regulator
MSAVKPPVTPNQSLVLHFALQHGRPFDAATAAADLGWSKFRAAAVLHSLIRKGYIRRPAGASNAASEYTITPAGRRFQ